MLTRKGASLAVCVVAAAVLATGCSSSSSRYEDVEALVAELREQDLGCTELSQADVNAAVEGAQTSSGSCLVAGESVQLFVFETEADTDLWMERGFMETVVTARGVNWVAVSETQEVADRIADALGGSS